MKNDCRCNLTHQTSPGHPSPLRPRVLGSEYSRTRIRVPEYSDPSTRALDPSGALGAPKVTFCPKVRSGAQSALLGPKTGFGEKRGRCRLLAPSGGRKTIGFTRGWSVSAPSGRQGAKSVIFWHFAAFGAKNRYWGPKALFGAHGAAGSKTHTFCMVS